MKKFCVALMEFHDNILRQEIVEAADWKSALNAHTYFSYDVAAMPDDYEEAQEQAFDDDYVFAVTEV